MGINLQGHVGQTLAVTKRPDAPIMPPIKPVLTYYVFSSHGPKNSLISETSACHPSRSVTFTGHLFCAVVPSSVGWADDKAHIEVA